MNEYRVIIHPEFRAQYRELRRVAIAAKDSTTRRAARAGIQAMKALRDGKEAKYRGERLGFDDKHYDLRDCAEIKVEVLNERFSNGKAMGPSHRMIYREFEPTGDDPRPIRQIVAFEHRKDGLPFKVAAQRLGRRRGFMVPELAGVSNVTPATGHKKDPQRPITPPRLPLPPDLAALLSTTQTAPPARVHAPPSGDRIRTADLPIRQRIRDR